MLRSVKYLHWFLQEQREEVASMTGSAVVERGKDNLLHVEEHLSRAPGDANPLESRCTTRRRRRSSRQFSCTRSVCAPSGTTMFSTSLGCTRCD